MKNTYYLLILFAFCVILFLGCAKKYDVFVSTPFTDYTNLAVGKFVTYRLDSFKYVNFGQKDTTVTYQAKDIIDAAITDNLGRPGWRVVRYLNDSAALGPWVPNLTYSITATSTSLEVNENNFRFLKLKAPVKNDFSWKGNSYINTIAPPDPLTEPDFSYLNDWNYTYQNVDKPFTVFATPVDSTVTVNQRDEILGIPNNVDSYSERNFSVEVYGKHIGLVYKKFLHWVFQPRNSIYPNGYYDGYGITLHMIDHN